MFRSFFTSKKYAWRAYGRASLLIGLTVLNVWLNIEIGRVIGAVGSMFEDSSGHDMIDFWNIFKWFVFCRAGFVFSDFILNYNSRMYAIDWRYAITEIFIPRWSWIIGKTTLQGVSQRLQEEPYNFSKFFDSMGLQLLHSVLQAFGFGLELSKISPTALHVPILGIDIGIMLVIAFMVFAVGLAGTVFLGRNLPKAESYNRDKEADFRERLVLTEDGKVSFDLENIFTFFRLVHKSYVYYFRKAIPLDIWKSLYYNSIATIPIVASAYWILVTGDLTIGGFPKIVFNFEMCMGGLSLFINNWRQIVDFIATKDRMKQLNNVLDASLVSDGKPMQYDIFDE